MAPDCEEVTGNEAVEGEAVEGVTSDKPPVVNDTDPSVKSAAGSVVDGNVPSTVWAEENVQGTPAIVTRSSSTKNPPPPMTPKPPGAHAEVTEHRQTHGGSDSAEFGPRFPQPGYLASPPPPFYIKSGTQSLSNPSSPHTSSTSLHALSEEGGPAEGQTSTIRRAPSTRSAQGRFSKQKTSHSNSSSMSNPTSWQPFGTADNPTYLNQSFSLLEPQPSKVRPPSMITPHTSSPSHTLLNTDMQTSPQHANDKTSPSGRDRATSTTSVSSPALFSPHTSRPGTSSFLDHAQRAGSPHLHATHLQTPKETISAEVEYDTFTGNKHVNMYEFIAELGRGQFGKVKKARDIANDRLVAIKIVPRFSKQRQLGRLGFPGDRVKKEVAILKKARHPNLVSLLEVIDDPSRQKIYIVLEFMDRGEIRWRTLGARDVTALYRWHLDHEKRGTAATADVLEQERFLAEKAQRTREARALARERVRTAGSEMNLGPFSLEHGDSPNEGDDLPTISRATSALSNFSDPPAGLRFGGDNGEEVVEWPDLNKSVHGSSSDDALRGRTQSLAISSISLLSSEFDGSEDEEHSFVPCMTLDEARRATRDTLLGLEFLHFQGIIHRDIKPANLLLAANGTVKISDFGVSYLGRPVNDEEEKKLTEADAETLDDPRELARTVGTPAFYAPELCGDFPGQFGSNEGSSGPRITGAIDLWALGITLYAMVYGRLPFYSDAGHFGLYQVICQQEVLIPQWRLLPATYCEEATPQSLSQSPLAEIAEPHRRLDHEYRLEEVPDTLRDLIASLLIKDPTKRITVENAKKHPWILEGIENPTQWVAGTNPRAQGKSKIQVDDRDVSLAVGYNFVQRITHGVTKIASSFLGRTPSRRRAASANTSASASNESIASQSNSSGSTVGKEQLAKEGCRSSLRGDEVFAAALKASREPGEHPLAQSQTASPDDEQGDSYFGGSMPTMKAASTDATTPTPDEERRPRRPDRGISSVSATESVKTIQAPIPAPPPGKQPMLEPSQESAPSSTMEAISTGIGGLFSGASRHFAGKSSRERRAADEERSTSSRRTSTESDAHATASVALSTASASGDIETPDALRTEVSPPETLTSPTAPAGVSHGRKQSYFMPPESSPEAWDRAQDINARKLLIESTTTKARQHAPAAGAPASGNECPPSPDDETHFKRIRSAMQNMGSASTIASSAQDEFVGGISQSTSNPSMVVSEASSLTADSFLMPTRDKEAPLPAPTLHGVESAEPAFMRTAETVKQDTYEEPVASYADDSDADDSEDEGIMFGGRPATKKV